MFPWTVSITDPELTTRLGDMVMVDHNTKTKTCFFFQVTLAMANLIDHPVKVSLLTLSGDESPQNSISRENTLSLCSLSSSPTLLGREAKKELRAASKTPLYHQHRVAINLSNQFTSLSPSLSLLVFSRTHLAHAAQDCRVSFLKIRRPVEN
jgi:hypothetical protein